MDKKNAISAGQLFCLFYVSHSIITLTVTPGLQNGESPQDVILSAPISLLLCLLSALPILALAIRHRGMSLLDCSRYRLGNAGAAVIAVCYGLLYLYIPSIALARYNVFVTTTMLPQASFILLSLAVAATACYGAFMGLEALARASGFIFIAVIASLLFIFCALFVQIDPLNFTPPAYDGAQPIVYGGLSIFSGMMELSLLAVLLPFVKGKVGKNFLIWSTGETITVALIGFFVSGVLGSYAKTQIFPFYTASTFAEIGALQRLDALFTAVWTCGLFIKVALFLIGFSLCVEGLAGQKAGKRSLFFGAAVVFGVGMILSSNPQLIGLLAGAQVTLPLAVLFFTGFPLLLLCADSVGRWVGRRRQRHTPPVKVQRR